MDGGDRGCRFGASRARDPRARRSLGRLDDRPRARGAACAGPAEAVAGFCSASPNGQSSWRMRRRPWRSRRSPGFPSDQPSLRRRNRTPSRRSRACSSCRRRPADRRAPRSDRQSCSGKSATTAQRHSGAANPAPIGDRSRRCSGRSRRSMPTSTIRWACLKPCSTCWTSRGIPYDWTIHDYHTICPRINLIGARPAGIAASPTKPGATAAWPVLGDDQGRPVVRVDRGLAQAKRRPARRGQASLCAERRCLPPSGAIFSRIET